MVDKEEKLTKHKIRLYKGDMEILQAHTPPRAATVIIRTLVRRYIKDKWPNAEVPEVEGMEIEL